MGDCILIYEPDAGGVCFTGPFESDVEAMNYAEENASSLSPGSWCVADLEYPIGSPRNPKEFDELLSQGWREVEIGLAKEVKEEDQRD
jgi:hypothetical protein